MTAQTYRPLRVIYRIEHFYSGDTELTIFNPTVRFNAPKQPHIDLDTKVWVMWGKPREIKVTVEPV